MIPEALTRTRRQAWPKVCPCGCKPPCVGSRCPRVCNAAPRSADWCRKLVEGGAEERVAALRDGRGVQRAAVAGEPREPLAVNHGRRVERGDGAVACASVRECPLSDALENHLFRPHVCARKSRTTWSKTLGR